MRTFITDIETDGFYNSVTTLHCIVSQDYDSGDTYISPKTYEVSGAIMLDHEEHLELLSQSHVVMHNGLGYDLPVLAKLCNYSHNVNNVSDTFILSSLFKPDRYKPKGCTGGVHSLEAWGLTFGIPKGDVDSFETYTPEMLDYCIRDVEITNKLYSRMLREISEYNWDLPIKIEHNMAAIASQQTITGVVLDVDKAYALVEELQSEIDKIDTVIQGEVLPKPEQFGVTVTKPFIKSGAYSSAVTKWFKPDTDVGGQLTRIKWVPINLNSGVQVKELLYKQGWKPTQWNYKTDASGRKIKIDGSYVKTSPILTEESYDSITGGVGQLIARRNTLIHRRRQVFNIDNHGKLKGWLNQVREDGRIEAQGTPQATNTGRFRHRVVVNVPKAMPKILYGKQMRELFTVPRGYKMLGTDASALEARMEAHYCYDFEGGIEYAHDLVDGDVHSKNMAFFGTDRDGAKSPKYCLTYGGQPPTLADTVGCTVEAAQRMYNAFWSGNTALAGFKESVEHEYRSNGTPMHKEMPGGWIQTTIKDGWILGLDGRKIFIRAPHACVNAKFQSGGSLVVKVATMFMNKWIKEANLDAKQIIHMHDEIQFEVHPRHVDKLSDICLRAWSAAGTFFKLKVPIVGTVAVGDNWSETH